MPTIRMSPATRLFLAGNTVSMIGTGLVVAFILRYLHQVRGVALPVVGGLLTASAGAGLLVVPLVGILLDRIGARRVLTGIVVGQAAARVLLAWAHNVATALPVDSSIPRASSEYGGCSVRNRSKPHRLATAYWAGKLEQPNARIFTLD